jgi:hypothetical protein
MGLLIKNESTIGIQHKKLGLIMTREIFTKNLRVTARNYA